MARQRPSIRHLQEAAEDPAALGELLDRELPEQTAAIWETRALIGRSSRDAFLEHPKLDIEALLPAVRLAEDLRSNDMSSLARNPQMVSWMLDPGPSRWLHNRLMEMLLEKVDQRIVNDISIAEREERTAARWRLLRVLYGALDHPSIPELPEEVPSPTAGMSTPGNRLITSLAYDRYAWRSLIAGRFRDGITIERAAALTRAATAVRQATGGGKASWVENPWHEVLG